MRKFTLALAVAAMTAGAAMAQEYTLNPEPGVVKDLQGITVTFAENVSFVENNKMPVAVLENTTTGTSYQCVDPDRNTYATEGTEYKLTFIQEGEEEADEVIIEPGDYTLTIVGMYIGELFNAEGEAQDVEWLDPITVEYSIEYPAPYTLSPAAGVATDLQGIVLDFTSEKVGFYDNSRMANAVLENLTTGSIYNGEANLNPKAESEGSQYNLVFLGEDDEEAPETIKEPGEYVLTVRGMFVGEGEDAESLPAIIAKYTIEYPVAYALDPADGVVSNLQGIKLTFADDVVSFYDNNKMPVAVLENTTSGEVYNCYEAERNTFAEAASQYVFYFLDEEEEELIDFSNLPGNYKLTIRGMYVGEGEDAESLPVITTNYTIEYPIAYELTPAADSTVENLQGIVLSFENDVVSFYENNKMAVAVLENNNTGVVYVCNEPDRNTFAEAASAYQFKFMDEDDDVLEAINVPGSYTLTIRGMYVEEGEEKVDLPNIVVNYTIAYPVAYNLEPANGAVLSEITEVVLDFYANNNIDFIGGNRAAAVITNGALGDDEIVFTCEYPTRNTKAESDGSVWEFKFVNAADENEDVVAINEPGMYYLTINGFATVIEGEGEEAEEEIDSMLPTIAAVYYVDGEPNEGDTSKVVDLTSPEGVYNVYSINGTHVVKNGSVDALKALGKGIYVINGHKVVIK